jgi:hypothetical protein
MHTVLHVGGERNYFIELKNNMVTIKGCRVEKICQINFEKLFYN